MELTPAQDERIKNRIAQVELDITWLISIFLRIDDDSPWSLEEKEGMLRDRLAEQARLKTELEELKHAWNI